MSAGQRVIIGKSVFVRKIAHAFRHGKIPRIKVAFTP
jgi:hypothetical protein